MWNAGTEKQNIGGWESQCFTNTTRIHTRLISVCSFSLLHENGMLCDSTLLYCLYCVEYWNHAPKFSSSLLFFFFLAVVRWSQSTFPPGVKTAAPLCPFRLFSWTFCLSDGQGCVPSPPSLPPHFVVLRVNLDTTKKKKNTHQMWALVLLSRCFFYLYN